MSDDKQTIRELSHKIDRHLATIADLRHGLERTHLEMQSLQMRLNDALHELEAARGALRLGPVPTPPADCERLRDWISYTVRAWGEERVEAAHLAKLCQEVHDFLDSVVVQPSFSRAAKEWVECNKGTPRQRIEKLVEILSHWNSGATVKVQG